MAAGGSLADDDFTLFGLPQRYALDRIELDTRWHALQSQAHPDRHAAHGAAAQRVAAQWSTRINEAHRRLKDPIARAAYLCKLRGAPVGAETNTSMPADFLAQQLAWREALDDASDAAAMRALQEEVVARERALLALLETLFDRDGDAVAAAAQLRALMFVARFRDDVDRRLDALEQ